MERHAHGLSGEVTVVHGETVELGYVPATSERFAATVPDLVPATSVVVGTNLLLGEGPVEATQARAIRTLEAASVLRQTTSIDDIDAVRWV